MPNYFDPHLISQIKDMNLRSLRLVESFTVGMHKSRLRGISTEFAQHRPYVQGDGTRHLDWKVFARTDRLYLKQYEAETCMPVWFLLDTSQSMFFKSERAAMSKFEYAATVVASLAYLLSQQKDTFGLAVFADRIHASIPPRGSASHFRNMLDVLSRAAGQGATDVSAALAGLAPQLKRRGLVMIVSDLVSETDRLGLGLGQLSFLGQDIVVFHVEDPIERDFPFAGQTIFLGSEQEGKFRCDPRDLRQAYLRERRAHVEGIRAACLRFGSQLEHMPTDAPLDVAISSFLSLRQARKK